MSDSRRTFIAKLLAAFSLPAWITKVWGKDRNAGYVPSDEAYSKWQIEHPVVPAPKFPINVGSGCSDFHSGMSQMQWLEHSSGRRMDFVGDERIVPKGWRMKHTPSSRMMSLKIGWRGDSEGFTD